MKSVFNLLLWKHALGYTSTSYFRSNPTTVAKTSGPETRCSADRLFSSEYDGDGDGGDDADRSLDLRADDNKRRLLRALSDIDGLKMGFGATVGSEDRRRVSSLADALIESSSGPTSEPLDAPSSWELLYGDAPDVLGFRGGPLSELVSARQTLTSDDALEVVLEYRLSDGLASLLDSQAWSDSRAREDRLEQTVVFDRRRRRSDDDVDREDEKARFELRPRGTRVETSRFGALPLPRLPFGDVIANRLPFVGVVRVLYNDGDLRIDRTEGTNFTGIYRRLAT